MLVPIWGGSQSSPCCFCGKQFVSGIFSLSNLTCSFVVSMSDELISHQQTNRLSILFLDICNRAHIPSLVAMGLSLWKPRAEFTLPRRLEHLRLTSIAHYGFLYFLWPIRSLEEYHLPSQHLSLFTYEDMT